MKNKSHNPSSSNRSERERNDELNKESREHEGKKLPGEYPPNEDIMNRQNMQRVGLDVENFSRAVGVENFNKTNEPVVTDPNDVIDAPDLSKIDDVERPVAREMERPVPKNINLDNDNINFVEGNESDVTEEDLQALGPRDLSLDMGEDEQLKNRVWPVDMAASDLDVPGGFDDNDGLDQSKETEDEENDFYSLGGDRHEDNLEGK